MKKILILGGGTGGLMAARELGEALRGEAEITVVDRRPHTEFRPSYLYVMMGYREPDQIRAPLSLLEKKGVKFHQADVISIDPENRVVRTSRGALGYDYLIISLGAETRPEAVGEGEFPSPWELDGALKARSLVKGFRGGRIVVAVHSTPYRCPPAPWEVALLLDFYYAGVGLRDKVRIAMVHPFKRPFENFGPLAAKMMEGLMEQRRIEWIGVGKNPAIESVDASAKRLTTTGGESVSFDALVLVPPHAPPKAISESPIADPSTGWARPHPPAMRTKYDDVYAVGDVAAPSLRLGMAGVILHSYIGYVTASIIADVKGAYISKDFRASGSCVLDVGGFGMAAMCDFTNMVLGRASYPDCVFLPPTGVARMFKEFFEKQYFSWLLGHVPG